jgi:hypothetical protein
MLGIPLVTSLMLFFRHRNRHAASPTIVEACLSLAVGWVGTEQCLAACIQMYALYAVLLGKEIVREMNKILALFGPEGDNAPTVLQDRRGPCTVHVNGSPSSSSPL